MSADGTEVRVSRPGSLSVIAGVPPPQRIRGVGLLHDLSVGSDRVGGTSSLDETRVRGDGVDGLEADDGCDACSHATATTSLLYRLGVV